MSKARDPSPFVAMAVLPGANGEVSIAPIEARPKAMRGVAGKQGEQVALVACGGGHTLVATR